MIVEIILGVVILLVVLTVLANRKGPNEPPGPLRLPYIGSMWALGTNPAHMHVALTQLAAKYGPVYKITIGKVPIVVLTDADVIRNSFHGLDAPITPRFNTLTTIAWERGVAIGFADKQTWIWLRKIFAHVARNYGGLSIPEIIIAEATKLFNHLDKSLGQEIFLNPSFMFYTRNILLHIVLRESWSFDTLDEDQKSFSASFLGMAENYSNTSDFFPEFSFLGNGARERIVYHAKRVEAYIKKIIEAREASSPPPEKPRDFMDVIISERKTNPKFTEDHMLASVRDLTFGGTFTVADALDWMLMYLCQHPDIQERCYAEINEKLQGRAPTMDDQAELKYLDCVIKEVFRLRPTGPLSLPHMADRDCNIGGFDVKEGTAIFTNLYGIGNLERYYLDHEKFDPERWIRSPELANNLLHFGYGPTICLGMPIAKQEMFLSAVLLLQRYKYKFAPNTVPDFTGEFKLAFNPKPWKVVLSLRN